MTQQMKFEVSVESPDAERSDLLIGQTVYMTDAVRLANAIVADAVYSAGSIITVRNISDGHIVHEARSEQPTTAR